MNHLDMSLALGLDQFDEMRSDAKQAELVTA